MGGWGLYVIQPLWGSILQVGTWKIFSPAENPRWSRVWQYLPSSVSTQFQLQLSLNSTQSQLNSTSTQTTELGTTQLKLVLDYLWLFRTISECLRLSWAISAYLGLTADYLKLSLTILGYLGLSQTILDYLVLFWTISDYFGLSLIIPNYLRMSRTILGYLGLSQTI